MNRSRADRVAGVVGIQILTTGRSVEERGFFTRCSLLSVLSDLFQILFASCIKQAIATEMVFYAYPGTRVLEYRYR